MRFGKGARLLRRRDFLEIQGRGRRLQAGAYVVVARPAETGRCRLGVTVSSRIGNAVVRNRVKRWVREAFRASAAELGSMDVVVIARSDAPQAGLAGARRAMAALQAAGARS